MADPLRFGAGAGPLILCLFGCARPDLAAVPVTEAVVPTIRVGVVSGAASVVVGGGSGLLLAAPDGGGLTELPAGVSATIVPGGLGLRVRLGGAILTPGPAINLTPSDSIAGIRVNGRDYRGRITLSATSGGVTAVNLLDLEQYVAGVVGAELGRRPDSELAALKAQAVVSRSIALKSVGRWRMRGYDLLATVADQAYSGTGSETPLANQATQETRGEVLTWQGQIIDAFFHSTCGGRTADGPEVFAAAERPYLRSIRDEDAAGRAWCASSPRFRWQESWPGDVLLRTLHETVPRATGTAGLTGAIRDLRVVDRTASGRVAHLELVGESASLIVSGPVARLVLRTADGNALRSAGFTLQLSRAGGRIVQLVAQGSGAGHGVGMCQWGALGRARAGFSYQDILLAYFPQTSLTRTY